MRKLAQCLVLFAIFAHVCLSIVSAYAASSFGSPSTGSFGSPSGFSVSRPSYGPVGTVLSPVAPSGNSFGSPAQPAPSECPALELTDISSYADPVQGLAKISGETQRHIERCACKAQGCVADALDKYAQALTQVAPRLPAALRGLPEIVASAAQRARSASTRKVAARILRAAVVAVRVAVRKTISLVRAADSDASGSATRGGELVARTLSVAASALERADSL